MTMRIAGRWAALLAAVLAPMAGMAENAEPKTCAFGPVPEVPDAEVLKEKYLDWTIPEHPQIAYEYGYSWWKYRGWKTADPIRLHLAFCPAGEFMMGSMESEDGRKQDERQHLVRISRPFLIGVTEITNAEYEAVTGRKPSSIAGSGNVPVHGISWYEAMDFCRRLNALTEGRRPAGYHFMLPTEAQWEYACRAGTTSVFHCGDALDARLANFDGRRPYHAEPMDTPPRPGSGADAAPRPREPYQGEQYPPNAWGIYDMHGNVSEWCYDWYCSFLPETSVDPAGTDQGWAKTVRGGSWREDGNSCRSAYRGCVEPKGPCSTIGFRIALVPFDGDREFLQKQSVEKERLKVEKAKLAFRRFAPERRPLPFPDEWIVNEAVHCRIPNPSAPTTFVTDVVVEFSLTFPLEMVPCPAGCYWMGSFPEEPFQNVDECKHRVAISHPFLIGKFEILQSQYEWIMGKDPSKFHSASKDRPAERVSWEEAMEFCRRLNELTEDVRPAGYHFSLPTEAQWEYACRAGMQTPYGFGKEMEDGSAAQTAAAGSSPANAWGICDMHANVAEWCLDWYAPYAGDVTDPAGPDSGKFRVVRGGAYDSLARACRSAMRNRNLPGHRSERIGFRVVLTRITQ